MPALKGSKTEQNLKDAFACESQAIRRYLYFAQKADLEGYNDIAAVFRSTAEGETGHAHGHLQFLDVGVVVEPGRSYFDTNVEDHHHFYFEDSCTLQDIARNEVHFDTLPKAPAGTKVARVDVVIRVSRDESHPC